MGFMKNNDEYLLFKRVRERISTPLNDQDADPMSTEENLQKKLRELEKELRWLEQKFHRSGVDPEIGMRTLLRMQKLTHDFLIWLVRRDIEKAKEKGEGHGHELV